MQKEIPVSLILFCVLAVVAAGCTSGPQERGGTTPGNRDGTVPVTLTAPQPPAPEAPGSEGTLTVSARAFTGTATLSLDGNDTGTLTQSIPLTMQLPQGAHTVRVCVESVCDTEVVRITALKTTAIDLSAKISDLAANTRPTVTVVGTTPSASRILVTVEFFNPGQDELTMTARVVCSYQYSGGNLGPGTASGSATAQAVVPAGGRKQVTETIVLPEGIGTVSVSSTPTLSDFQYSRTAG